MGSLQTIQNLLIEQFELKLEDLTPEVQLVSLGLDSLSVIELMFSLEDKLKIKIPDGHVDLKTIADLVGFIDKVINEQKSLA